VHRSGCIVSPVRVVFVRPAGGGVYEYVTRAGARLCPDASTAVIKAVRYAKRVGAKNVRVWP